MNRWQAITQIVRLFISKERPGYALAALALFVVPPVVADLVAYSLGSPPVSAISELRAPH